MPPRSEFPVVFLFLLALAAGGCGGEDGPARAAVSGTVTAGGAPVAAGTVTFTPVGGGPRTSATLTDGSFAVPAAGGPVVGEHRVTVTPARPDAPAPDDEAAALRLLNAPPARTKLPPPGEFPATVTEGGPNAFAFDLPPAR